MKKLLQINTKEVLGVLTVYISRLGMLPANISPVGAFGFFGNPLLYFFSLLAFDFLVGGLYRDMLFTYAGFGMYALLGYMARNDTKKQMLFLPLASFLFFLISNFGSFLYWYPNTWAGLAACYVAAVPFYTRTLLGDMAFGYGYLLFKTYKAPIIAPMTTKATT